MPMPPYGRIRLIQDRPLKLLAFFISFGILRENSLNP